MTDIVSPIDGAVAYSFERLPLADALARLEKAEAAQLAWRTTPMQERIRVCRGMLETYRRHLGENAEQITRMMGKPLAQARGEFEGGTVERTNHLCDIAPDALAPDVPEAKPGLKRFIAHEPVGVVLDIAAWNYPLLIAVNVIVPSVLAGNAVLVKHATQTALVADQFERAFLEAGAPEGIVQAFPVDHDVAAQVIATRRIGYVSFTGSVRGGRNVARTVATDNFIGLGLELGGKDPALVLPDCDFEFTVENLVDGAFYNAGQSVLRDRADLRPSSDVLRSTSSRSSCGSSEARVSRLGDPLDEATTLGPMVDAKSADFVREQVEAAAGLRRCVRSSSAIRRTFGVPDRLVRAIWRPQVLVDVDHSMSLMVDETFGPAIGIMRDRERRPKRASRLMNDSEFGLTASIWSA